MKLEHLYKIRQTKGAYLTAEGWKRKEAAWSTIAGGPSQVVSCACVLGVATGLAYDWMSNACCILANQPQ